MAFRRPESDAEWHAIAQRFRDRALRCGVPFWVIDDARIWGHFIQCGYAVDMLDNRRISLLDLSDEQVLALIDLLIDLGETAAAILSCIGSHALRAQVQVRLGEPDA